MPTERLRPAIGDAKLDAAMPGGGVSDADCHVAGSDAGGKAKNLAGCSSSIASGVARFCDSGSMVISRPGMDITIASSDRRALGADLVRMEFERFDMM